MFKAPAIVKKINIEEYFKNTVIPDDWNTLEEFVDWYFDSRMPILPPWNAEVIKSDDAVAICVFKKGHYQVEFYLEHPMLTILEHCHPGMEVIIVELGGGGLHGKNKEFEVSNSWGQVQKKLMAGEYHGGDTSMNLGKGYCILAFQRWENCDEMHSAATQWKGELHGNIQAELIKKHKGDVFVEGKIADITLNANGTPKT